MSDYTNLKKISVSDIEGFINRMVTDDKISVSYQRSLVGAIKKLYELNTTFGLDPFNICPQRSNFLSAICPKNRKATDFSVTFVVFPVQFSNHFLRDLKKLVTQNEL